MRSLTEILEANQKIPGSRAHDLLLGDTKSTSVETELRARIDAACALVSEFPVDSDPEDGWVRKSDVLAALAEPTVNQNG